MRQIGPLSLALVLVTCGGTVPLAASSATPPATPPASVAALATLSPTYAPTAAGFTGKLLVETLRNLPTSAPAHIRIVAGAATDGSGVSAVVSESESFTASYRAATDRATADGVRIAYVTPDLPPLAARRYSESLRLITVQPGGRSAAHMHSGIEGVLVLEGSVLIRSGGNAPSVLAPGQGFYILPKVPVQLINVGTGVARTPVYSISPECAPFSTGLGQAP
jgi:quercetin dioxygenase-like cupin family protein